MEGTKIGGSGGGDSPTTAKPVDWSYLYAELRTTLGYTTEQIDNLNWQDYLDLCAYWKKHPPTHILVAGFMGYKAPTEIATEASQDFAIEELMTLFPVQVVPKGGLPDVG